MSNATLPSLSLETQGITLPVSDIDVTQQTESIEEESHQDNNSGQLFIQGIDIPALKKYYKKLRRNIFISIFIAQSVFMAAIWFVFVESGNLWGWSATKTFSASALESVKSTGLWAQVPISVSFASFLIGLVKNLFRLSEQKKKICWECDLCQSGRYPTHLTPALSQKILALFSWRLNGFWTGFTIMGLAVVAAVYGYLIRGFSDSYWQVKWNELHTNFFAVGKTTGGTVIKISVGVGVLGFLVLLSTNICSRISIKSALKIFNTNEMNMQQELREKVFRLNKRNKIISTVILCVLGLAIFIILKRLIIAVFNRSFNVSRW